jgi:hypothetical protein
MGDPRVASPIECEGQGRLALRHIPGPMPHLVGRLPRISVRRTSENSVKRKFNF